MQNKTKQMFKYTTEELIKIIRDHNKWRRGDDSKPMQNPTELGIALDEICDKLEYLDVLQDSLD